MAGPYDFLKPPVPPNDDPYEVALRDRQEDEVRAQLISSPDPVRVQKANALARNTDIPASTIERNMVQIEAQKSLQRAVSMMQGLPLLAGWLSETRNLAGVAGDDAPVRAIHDAFTKAKIADYSKSDGFFDRAGDLIGRAVVGLDAGGERLIAAGEQTALWQPPWMPDDVYARESAKIRRRAKLARMRAPGFEAIAATPIENEGTYSAFKANPNIWSFGRMVRDQSLPSLVYTAGALVSPGALFLPMVGSMAQTRAVNDGRKEAAIGDVLNSSPYAGTSIALDRFGFFGSVGAKGANAATRVGKAAAIEGVTEFTQSGLEYAGGTLGTEKGFDAGDAFEQAIAGALVGAPMGAGFRAVAEVGGKVRQVRIARKEASFIDAIGTAGAQTTLRQNDPDGFQEMVKAMADGAGVDNIYVPAEAAQILFQADYDAFDDFRGEWQDALASGGDLVIPVEVAATRLAGTPQWEALKPDMRLTPGGVSLREAETFDEDMAGVMSEVDAVQEADATPREKLFENIATKLQDAGFTVSAARTQAELLASRYAARAARKGEVLTGEEFTPEVRSVVPDAIGRAVAADQTDILIESMRTGGRAVNLGPSLLSFIRKQGGIDDLGGDLAAMGAVSIKGVAKKGASKVIRKAREDFGQGDILGPTGNNNSPDALALAAWQAGYFPEFTERPDVNALFAAIDKELRGEPVYAEELKTDFSAQAEELRAYLASAGLDPENATNEQIKAVLNQPIEGDGFEQAYPDGPRGRIVFPSTGIPVIELFKGRNLSTFLHETGHLFLEELRFDANIPEGSAQAKADWVKVQAWFVDNGVTVGDGPIPVEAHELWARGFERYLMEGKSPSPALRRAFQSFKAWMIAVYRTVARLNSPISDEIRGVMNRLIATDEEIAQVKESQNLEAKFKDATDAGMTGPEFEAYSKLVNNAQTRAQDEMLAKAMVGIRKSAQKDHKARRDAIRAEVAEDVAALPEFKAIEALKANPISRGWLIETYGPDAPDLFYKSVPPLSKASGSDPELMAQLVGFSSADEMARTLMGLEKQRKELKDDGRSPKNVLIDQRTDEILMERYGDPFTDGTLEREALEAVHNELQGEVIAAELRVFARSTGRRPTPYRLARQWAREKIRSGKVADVASPMALQRYRRAAAKAGKAAMEAHLKGNAEEAFRQTQAQMIQNAMVSEGKAALDEVEAIVERLGKIARRRTAKTIDQDYLEQAQALLEQIDLRKRSQLSVDRVTSFEAWATEQETLGHDVVVPSSFAERIGQTNWSRLTVDDLVGVDEAVKQIIHLGRLKQTLLDNKERREFDAVRGEALAGMGNLRQKPPSDLMEPSFGDRVKSGVLSFDAALIKMELLFDFLDGGNPNGVFNRVVFRPIAEAQGRGNGMLADFQGRIVEAMEAADTKRWYDRVEGHGLLNRETGNEFVLTRQSMVAMALNMGNEGNIQRLVDGYGWNEQNVRDVLARELSKSDWDFVQSVWDIINELWPDIAAMERRVNGVEPEKVEAVPVETPHGTYRGGYYPAIYDSAKDVAAQRNAGKESDLFSVVYTKANTRASATKDRAAKVSRPILLQLSVINRHLSEVIHDVTHREAVMQADKFLSDPAIIKAVNQTMGPEYSKLFRPWLKFIANQWAIERTGAEGLSGWMQKLRSNVTVVGMGLRVATILSQIAGYANSAEYIGPHWLGLGFAAVARNGAGSRQFVIERSAEIRDRIDNIDRDIAAGIRALQGKRGWRQNAQRFSFHTIGLFDQAVVIPTWLGAYEKALSEGMDDADAAFYADKAVRLSQGASSAKDMAAVMRGQGQWGEALKLMTFFYTYMSAFYNRQRALGRDTRGAVTEGNVRDFPKLLGRFAILFIVAPLLTEVLTGRTPKEDEEWDWWVAKNILFNAFGGLPGIRDVVRPAVSRLVDDRSFGYTLSPLNNVGASIENVFGDIGNLIEGDPTKRATRNTIEATGYLTGLVPGGQVGTTAQFMVDVFYGEQDPETLGEWYEGLTKGKITE